MNRPDDAVPVADLIAEGADILRRAGIAEPRRRARQLVEALSGVETAAVIVGAGNVPPDIAGTCHAGFRRLAAGEPLSRIVGRREFWGLAFDLSAATLDPRPETETLVRVILDLFPDRGAPLAICDLGTGSGAIAVAVLTELRQATCVAVDRSTDAVRMARRNAEFHGVGERLQPVCADWLTPFAGPYDAILSNPPYIRTGDLCGLDAEVRDFDPAAALDGGSDGLDAYRVIIAGAPDSLAPGGWLVVEIGAGMAGPVSDLAAATGAFEPGRWFDDLSGIARVGVFRRR